MFGGGHKDIEQLQLARGGLPGKGLAAGPQPLDVAGGQLHSSLADVDAH